LLDFTTLNGSTMVSETRRIADVMIAAFPNGDLRPTIPIASPTTIRKTPNRTNSIIPKSLDVPKRSVIIMMRSGITTPLMTRIKAHFPNFLSV